MESIILLVFRVEKIKKLKELKKTKCYKEKIVPETMKSNKCCTISCQLRGSVLGSRHCILLIS